MRTILLYIVTIRYLKVSQLVFRLWRKLYRPAIPALSTASLRRMGKLVTPAVKSSAITGFNLRSEIDGQPLHLFRSIQFSFLNHAITYRGKIDWSDSRAQRLWLYNLHYFDYLNSTQCQQHLALSLSLISDWIKQNPPLTCPAWEPYPCSLRIVNWIKWHLHCQGLTQEMQNHLALQVRWLCRQIEYHILANHLFANAKALLIAGLFFEGPEAERWLQKGEELVSAQLDEQILADGGHYERSPMYHAIVLEDVLDLLNVARASDQCNVSSLLEKLELVAKRMLEWMAAMCHPDDRISFFNDAAFDISIAPTELRAYANRLRIAPGGVNIDSKKKSAHLVASGYVRMQNNNYCVLVDVAPVGPNYQPGHAHADTLSFEMSYCGHRVFVNSGTSTYESGELRAKQRATVSHNTLEIDGLSSSVVWGGFRVAQRAVPQNVAVHLHQAEQQVMASHNGYQYLGKNVMPRREYHLTETTFTVSDTVDGSYQSAVARFYLHPGVAVRSGQRLVLSSGQELCWQIEGGEAEVHDALWYPRFGQQIESTCIVARKHRSSSVPLTFRLQACK